MTLAELTQELGSRARAMEVLHWLWEERTEALGRASRSFISRCDLLQPHVVAQSHSEDGTTKWALRLEDAAVETVLIPAKGRSTVCVSSQAGCTRNCAFCATARLGFKRNLRAGEIVAQYMLARAHAPKDAPARNVVFMGMGEPMDNLDEVLRAIEVLTQAPGPQLGARHITVSTSGVLPGMQRFLRDSRASLALSMNASSDEQRAPIMPQTRSWPLAALMDELREDARRDAKRVHFIEYVLFQGVNDSDEDALRVARLLKGIRARVNLIPHNAFEGSPFRPPAEERMLAFQRQIIAQGLPCFIRWSRGRDVQAACGQLALSEGRDEARGWRTLGRTA
jgi:23S rRNA (adenine2503-C2)-methyltransferase